MDDVTQLADTAGGADPRTGLRAALALRKLAETLERLQVGNARANGWSWQDIAEALEISKQAVHKKYADARVGHTPNDRPRGGPRV